MKHSGPTHLQLGKNGITEGVIDELNLKLNTTDPLKIKLNSAFCDTHDRKEAAEQLAQQTSSRIESLVGGTLILTRKH